LPRLSRSTDHDLFSPAVRSFHDWQCNGFHGSAAERSVLAFGTLDRDGSAVLEILVACHAPPRLEGLFVISQISWRPGKTRRSGGVCKTVLYFHCGPNKFRHYKRVTCSVLDTQKCWYFHDTYKKQRTNHDYLRLVQTAAGQPATPSRGEFVRRMPAYLGFFYPILRLTPTPARDVARQVVETDTSGAA
jgi:hypothetical protein